MCVVSGCEKVYRKKLVTYPFALISTYLMLARALEVKTSLALALLNTPKVEIEISQKEFDLCEKVANILQMFCEATKLLSKEDCSISNSILIVTTIVTQLSSKSAADWGVKTLKSGLLDSFKTRFPEMESEKHCTVNTYLDPRYKMYYYRDTSTIDDVREIITEYPLVADCTICVFFRYFRSNKPEGGRTIARTNLTKNEFL